VGSRVCTIQWTSLSYYFTSTRTINYQVKLYEGTNVIEFWYGAAPTGTINTSESASIGIKSITGGNGQYIDAVTGSSFTGNSSLQSDRWPSYNFRFTPGAPTPLAGGTYNVGIGQTYRNLNEAAADVNHRGVSGAVTFNLIDAQYDITVANGGNFFPILIGPVSGTSAANTVTFTKLGTAAIVSYGGASGSNGAIANQANITALASNVDPVFGIVGGDYITINNMDIRGNTGNNASDHGVGIYNSSATDGATNNTISNITVTMVRANTGSRGFVSNVITTPSSASGANSNNTFRDFTITSVYAGIQLSGNATFPDLNTQVTRSNCATFNTIGNPSTANDIGNGTSQTYGILATNQSGFTISNNSIRNVTGSAAQTDGIVINSFQGTCTVSNNKIQTIRNSSTSSTTGISGLRMSHTTTGTHTIRVFNNTISEITSAYTGIASTARTLKGIFVSGTGGSNTQTYEVYNNAVSMDGAGSLNLSSSCFEVNTATGPVYRLGNNIFANFTPAQTGVARHYIFSSPTTATFGPAGTVSNNNDIFLANDAGVSGFTGFDGTTAYNTLANWTAAMAPAGMEAASLTINPQFVSNTANLNTAALTLNAAGQVPPVYITVDQNCAPRTPDNDIGSYVIAACSGTPTAGTITGVTAVCSGSGTTLTLTGASTGAGITYQWASSLTNGGPYTTLLGTSNTQATGPLTATTYFVVGVGCTVSGQVATTAQFTVAVNPLPAVAVTPSTASVCVPVGSPVNLLASGATTYSWLPASGLSSTTIANPTANPAATTTYTVTGTDGNGCAGTATAAITVSESPSITNISATPSTICSGGNSQLTASAATTASYTGSVITYTLTPTPGVGVTTLASGGTAVTPLSSGTLDDGGWQNQTIPFSFMYFGTAYTSFAVSTNGFIVLGTGAPNTFTGYYNTFPSAFSGRPAIGPLYSDLDFRTAGTITYFVSGTAPNRKLVINWSNGNFYSGIGSLNTQLVIYETTNIIEAHTTSSTGTNSAVQGIQNAAGTTAVVAPGRNNVTWTVSSPDAYRWTPTGGAPTYSWTPATFLSSTTISNPIATAVTTTTTYTLTASNGACSSSASVTVTTGTPLSATATASPSATVCVGSNITLNATANGGGAPYTYSWAGPNSFSSTSQNPTISSVTLAAAGTYTLTINDGCSSVATASVTLVVNGLPTIAVAPNTGLICLPGGGPIALSATGGSTYAWLPASGLSSSTVSNPSAFPTASTTYTVTGTDGNGCSSTATAAITVATAVVMDSVVASSSSVCPGDSATLMSFGRINSSAYCQPTYTNGTGFGDYLSLVQLGSINNATGAAPNPYYTFYAPSATTTTTLVAGNTYTITISPGTYTINDVGAWIDFNGNGILNDVNEKLGETNNMGAAPATTSFTFTVPLTATNGPTRLRVRDMDYGGIGIMDPCASQSSFGETEDYTVTIVGGVDPLTYAWTPSTFLTSTTNDTTTAAGVTTTTEYFVTATSAAGCSATDSIEITVNTLPTVVANASANPICVGDSVNLYGSGAVSYVWNNSVVDSVTFLPAAADTFIVIGTDANGCVNSDSLILTINPLPSVALSGNNLVCSGDSVMLTGTSGGTSQWYLNGSPIVGATSNTYYAATAGVYNMTKTNLNGCSDSAATGITVSVVLPPTVTVSGNTAICNGDSTTLVASGAATYTWVNGPAGASYTVMPTADSTFWVVGVDSTATCSDSAMFMVTVNPTYVTPQSVHLCFGDSVTVGSNTYYNAGVYNDTLPTINGCDSVFVTTVTADTAIISASQSVVICSGDSVVVGSSVYTTAGTYMDTVTSSLGCDSMITTTVTVTTPVTTSQSVSVCFGDSYSIGSNTYSASGTYTDTLSNIGGCDSVVVTTLTVAPQLTSSQTINACNVDTVYVGSSAYTVSGVYVDTLISINGCDSIVTSNINFGGLNAAVSTTNFGGTLVASPSGLSYQWMNCQDNTVIISATMQNYTPSANGQFAVIVSDTSGCIDTSSCITVTSVGVEETVALNEMSVYPNPNNGLFTVSIPNADYNEMTIEVVSIDGKVIYSDKFSNVSGTFTNEIDMTNAANGTYFLRVTADGTTTVVKVVRAE
jgi:hypothetical protein